MAAMGAIFSGISMIVGAMGQSAAMAHEAQKAARAAEIGRVRADQVDAAYREDFNTTLANITAIRAATNADPASPTSLAYIEGERKASETVRRIKVGGERLQANQDEADASYYKSASRTALLGGALQSIPAFLGAFG